MRKNMFKVMALSLAMATLSTTAAFAAGWGKVGSGVVLPIRRTAALQETPGSILWSAMTSPVNSVIRLAIRTL